MKVLNNWFRKFNHFIDDRTPRIIAETANEYFRESFQRKSFGGVKWKETKKPVKRGSLMARSGALLNSIRPTVVSAQLVRISAGSSKVPYAKIHNLGGVINRNARTENIVRNRYKTGPKSKYFGGMGAFKKGTTLATTENPGLSFKAYTIKMPQRQFMGASAELNKRIILRIRAAFNSR